MTEIALFNEKTLGKLVIMFGAVFAILSFLDDLGWKWRCHMLRREAREAAESFIKCMEKSSQTALLDKS